MNLRKIFVTTINNILASYLLVLPALVNATNNNLNCSNGVCIDDEGVSHFFNYNTPTPSPTPTYTPTPTPTYTHTPTPTPTQRTTERRL